MNVLEKILEEIEETERRYDEHTNMFALGGCSMAAEIKEIICSHMNDNFDDWIPCSERLPEESGHYLVQLSRKIPYENFADRIVVLYDGEEKAFLDYESLIIAWQPLPEPYKSKETVAAGMEHIVSRFTKVE